MIDIPGDGDGTRQMRNRFNLIDRGLAPDLAKRYEPLLGPMTIEHEVDEVIT